MKLKSLVSAAMSVVMFAGCVSEQERQSRVAAERQSAKDQTLQEIANCKSVLSLIDQMVRYSEPELKLAAEKRTRELSQDAISKSKAIVLLEAIVDKEKFETLKARIISDVKSFEESNWQFGEVTVEDNGFSLRNSSGSSKANAGAARGRFGFVASVVEKAREDNPGASPSQLTLIVRKELAKPKRDITFNLDRCFPPFIGIAKYAHEKDIKEIKDAARDRIAALKKNDADKKIETEIAKLEGSYDKRFLEKMAREAADERIRIAAQKRLKVIEDSGAIPVQTLDKHYEDLAEHNYHLALQVFTGTDFPGEVAVTKTRGPFDKYKEYMVKFLSNYAETDSRSDLKKLMKSDKPWQKLVEPRRKLSEEEKNAGKSKLEEFGTHYLPNAYSNYEKIRDQAMEIQQMFNEEFPDPFSLKKDSPKWNTYTKLLKGLMKVRTQAFRRHDELCHFYLLHKVGALSAADLAKIDSGKISIWLYEENLDYISFDTAGVKAQKLTPLDEKVRTFAEKQAPETYAFYQKCEITREETMKLLSEILSDVRIMDITRFELPIVACREKIDFITQMLNTFTAEFQSWQVEYKTMEKDAAAIAVLDHRMALKWKAFVELLPSYLADRANGPLIAANNPMKKYYPCDAIYEWHLFALGFQHGTDDVRDLVYDQPVRVVSAGYKRDERNEIRIGAKLDQPTFLTGIDPKLIDASVSRSRRPVVDLGLLGHKRGVRIRISDWEITTIWISASSPVPLVLGVPEISSQPSDKSTLDKSAFLARLNEISEGKGVYAGIDCKNEFQRTYSERSYDLRLTVKMK